MQYPLRRRRRFAPCPPVRAENPRGGLHVLQRYYASIAEDDFGKVSSVDQRTPVSIYHVTSYKTRVNASKRYIDIRNLDLFHYPGDSDLVLAEFTQDYSSNNYHPVTRKQQY